MARRRSSTEHANAHELLRSLPHSAVVMDASGDAWQEGGLPSLRGLWYRAYGDDKPLSSHELAFQYPITVMEKGKTS